jgi:hypothetical protein
MSHTFAFDKPQQWLGPSKAQQEYYKLQQQQSRDLQPPIQQNDLDDSSEQHSTQPACSALSEQFAHELSKLHAITSQVEHLRIMQAKQLAHIQELWHQETTQQQKQAERRQQAVQNCLQQLEAALSIQLDS